MSEVKLRHEVQWFAEQMELKLGEDKVEGGGEGQNPYHLVTRLGEELENLNSTLVHGPRSDHQSIIGEATNLANLAMMLATNAKNDSFQFP